MGIEEIRKTQGARHEIMNTSEEIIGVSTEEKVYLKLAQYFKDVEVEVLQPSGKRFIKFVVPTDEDLSKVSLLFSLTTIEPWINEETRVVSIENEFDIVDLIERGVIALENFDNEERALLDYSSEIDFATEYIVKHPYTIGLKPIPEIFEKNDTQGSSVFDDMTEDGDEEGSIYHGDTSFLYRTFLKKYKREKPGLLFRKQNDSYMQVSEAEQEEIFKNAQAGDEKSRNEFLIMNIGLVYFVTLNMCQKYPFANMAELLQEALMEMNLCIDKYQEDTTGPKAKFSTYATVSMSWMLVKYLNNSADLVRVPVSLRSNFRKIRLIKEGLKNTFQRDSRAVVLQIIQNELEISESSANNLLETFESLHNAKYVDIDDLDEEDEKEYFSDSDNSPDQMMYRKELKELFGSEIDHLTPRQRLVLRSRYLSDLTLEEVGERLQVTKERVRQIEVSALRILRSPIQSANIRNYIGEDLRIPYVVEERIMSSTPPLDMEYREKIKFTLDDLKGLTVEKLFSLTDVYSERLVTIFQYLETVEKRELQGVKGSVDIEALLREADHVQENLLYCFDRIFLEEATKWKGEKPSIKSYYQLPGVTDKAGFVLKKISKYLEGIQHLSDTSEALKARLKEKVKSLDSMYDQVYQDVSEICTQLMVFVQLNETVANMEASQHELEMIEEVQKRFEETCKKESVS